MLKNSEFTVCFFIGKYMYLYCFTVCRRAKGKKILISISCSFSKIIVLQKKKIQQVQFCFSSTFTDLFVNIKESFDNIVTPWFALFLSIWGKLHFVIGELLHIVMPYIS